MLTHALIPVDQVAPALTGRYLVKGVIDRGALSCIFGPPNGGKTFVALDLAAHVAAGRNWHGYRVGPGGPVIYITAEGGAAFGNRIAALRATDPDLVKQATQGGMAILPVALDLCRSDDAAHLLDLIEDATDAPPVLIVIDTLARAMGEGNENDGSDMGALIRAAGRIQNETGAHVMLVHHTGKNSDRGPPVTPLPRRIALTSR